MKTSVLLSCSLTLLLLAAGCGTSYSWRSAVPAGQRTVSVPTFRNESDVMGLGSKMTTQLLREFQREGTYKIADSESAALEVQGIVKSSTCGTIADKRRSGHRLASYDAKASVSISIINKRTGEVVVNDRLYTARTTFSSGPDTTTGLREASGRLAEDLARQVVDDILALGAPRPPKKEVLQKGKEK